MSQYDFIIDNIKFSYSSATSYETCAGGFKLTYIDAEDRINNAFSDFGNLVHDTLEKFFKGEMEIEQLESYYDRMFDTVLLNDFPPYPPRMRENYYNAGIRFFKNFEFDKSLYEIVFIEDYINAEYQGIKLTVKPDLILKEISTGNYYLVDYKTAKIKTNKKDKEKQIDGYKKQFLLYSFFLWTERNIEIKQMKIWFIRDEIEMVIPVDAMEAQETIDWFVDTIKKIKNEEKWEFNNSKENKYFCDNICGLRNICPSR